MEVAIKVEDYLSEEEIKDIAKEQIACAIREKFKKESDIERIITNLSYEFLFNAVSESIGEDSLVRYLIWRKKDAWENEQSPAVDIMYQAIKDNHELIENRVYELINNYNFNEAKEEIYNVVCNAIEKQLFGKD